MAEYGENIELGCRCEISPHYDLWMRGARFCQVEKVKEGIATVRMDHPQVKKLQRVPVSDLVRRV